MLEAHANSDASPVTQERIIFGRRCSEWTEEEMETLRRIAPKVCTAAELAELFPSRTIKAVKKQLSRVRGECGYLRNTCNTRGIAKSDRMLDPGDEGYDDSRETRSWRKAAERGNRLYLAALRRAGYIPMAA